MASNFYFKDRSGAQNGPVTLDELTTLARYGRIPPDCPVWEEGREPAPAAGHPALAGVFSDGAAAQAAAAGPLEPSFPVWGLFWRSVVFVFGVAFVIPAPWVGLWYYRWLAGNVALPGGRRLSLESSFSESWYIFAGLGLVEFIGPAFAESPFQGAASLVSLGLSLWLAVALYRWFCRSLRAAPGGLSLAFEGGFWAYAGWILLLAFSTLTIVGWAWVLKYMTRWVCENVVGTHAFEFVGAGWDLLWRTLLVAIALGFLLPFPWALRWFVDWFVSQIVVAPRAADAAGARPLAA